MHEESLNPLQIAYLIGRTSYLPLGEVGMHDFREFRGEIDASLLKQSLTVLVKKHEALRTIIDPNKFIQTVSEENKINFSEINFCDLSREKAMSEVDQLRTLFSHQVYDLSISPWHVWLVQLPKDENHFPSILFISFDALTLDGYSISVLLSELFKTYHQLLKNEPISQESNNKFNQLNHIDFFSKKEEDVLFWENKLTKITQVLNFSWKQDLESIKSSRYQRESISISKKLWDELSQLAIKNSLLPNSLLNSIILESLSIWGNQKNIYIAVPISFSLYQKNLGNKSTIIPITYHHDENKSILEKAFMVQNDTLEALEHISFSGIEIARIVCDKIKTSLPFPVVLTNALSWIAPENNEDLYYHSGQTQTPQVAMDIRLSFSATKDLIIDIDYAEKAIDSVKILDLLKIIEHKISNNLG